MKSKRMFVPKVYPDDESCISQEEWVALSQHFLDTLSLIEALCPKEKENCEKLREFAMIEVKE